MASLEYSMEENSGGRQGKEEQGSLGMCDATWLTCHLPEKGPRPVFVDLNFEGSSNSL